MPGSEPQAFLLEFTGNETRAEWVVSNDAAQWDDKPIEVWVMNYPGYGGSTGPARMVDIPTAALAVFDHLRAEAHGRPVFVAGTSLGGATALYVASRRPAAAVVLRNPLPLRHLLLARMGWCNLWIVTGAIALGVPAAFDSPDTATKVTVPAVFAIAQDDRFIPPQDQKLIYDAYAGPKHLLRTTGGHWGRITPSQETAMRHELSWIWESTVGTVSH